MDTSVAAAVITSGVALVVAIGGGMRSELRSSSDRRYERRQAFLTEAQDAALELRNALREYGSSLRARTGSTRRHRRRSLHHVGSANRWPTDVSAADGRFAVAASRVEDERVVAALDHWHALARVSLIDTSDAPAADEQRAFTAVNDLIGAALRSPR